MTEGFVITWNFSCAHVEKSFSIMEKRLIGVQIFFILYYFSHTQIAKEKPKG